jgi:hypothetical protein
MGGGWDSCGLSAADLIMRLAPHAMVRPRHCLHGATRHHTLAKGDLAATVHVINAAGQRESSL